MIKQNFRVFWLIMATMAGQKLRVYEQGINYGTRFSERFIQ